MRLCHIDSTSGISRHTFTQMTYLKVLNKRERCNPTSLLRNIGSLISDQEMHLIFRRARVGAMGSTRLAHSSSYKQYMSKELKQKFFQHNGYASGSVILHRIGSAPDSSSSILLQTPIQSYLFNCGEGIERGLTSCGTSLDTVSQVFLTQKTWQTLGGVAMLINKTSNRYGSPPTFHGSEDIFTSVRRIGYLSAYGASFNTTVRPEIVNETESYEDADVRIDKIAVANKKRNANYAAFSYLCKLKALEGAPVSKQWQSDTGNQCQRDNGARNMRSSTNSLHRIDSKIISGKSTEGDHRAPDRPEINFLGKTFLDYMKPNTSIHVGKNAPLCSKSSSRHTERFSSTRIHIGPTAERHFTKN